MQLLKKKRGLFLVALAMLGGGVFVAQMLPNDEPGGTILSQDTEPMSHVPVFGPLTKSQMEKEGQLIQKMNMRSGLIKAYIKTRTDKRALEHSLLSHIDYKKFNGVGSLSQALRRVEVAQLDRAHHQKEADLLRAGLADMGRQDKRYGCYYRWLMMHEAQLHNAATRASFWSAERERRAPAQARLESMASMLTQIDHRLKSLNIEIEQMHHSMVYKSASYKAMEEIPAAKGALPSVIDWPLLDQALALTLRYMKPDHAQFAQVTGLLDKLPVLAEGEVYVPINVDALDYHMASVPDVTGQDKDLAYALTPGVREPVVFLEAFSQLFKDGASYIQAAEMAALRVGYQFAHYWRGNHVAHDTNRATAPHLIILTQEEAMRISPAQLSALAAKGVSFILLQQLAPELDPENEAELKNTQYDQYHKKGLALLAKGQGVQALDWLQKAMKAKKNRKYKFDFARALLSMHQYNKAEEIFSEMIARNPWDAQAILYRSIVWHGLGQKSRAYADLISAAHLAPDDMAVQEIYHHARYGNAGETAYKPLAEDLKTFIAPDGTAPVYLLLPKGQPVKRGACSWHGWCSLQGETKFLGYVPQEVAGKE